MHAQAVYFNSMETPAIGLPVLILEDEPFITLDVEELLAAHGYGETIALSRGSEALSWLEINVPRLAIIDPRLSDGVCSAVVRLLAERRTPFIVYSGETSSLTDEEPAFGAGELVLKPAPPEDIMAVVARALKSVQGTDQR
ncbi:response regulator [Rhizobium leguminosarum]|nr:response regulator [Rhizobium leguminosarum]